MKITRRELRTLIKEALGIVSESSAEYTSINKPLDVQKAIRDIYGRIIDLEDAVRLMGGDIVSFKQNAKDIEDVVVGGLKVAAPR